jgi:AcrR family transcriptional regulator
VPDTRLAPTAAKTHGSRSHVFEQRNHDPHAYNVNERTVDTSAALLAAASDLLTRGGPAFVTLRAVGAAAGVSRTAPYRHFRDKDDLLSAVAAENLLLMAASMRRAAEDGDAGGTALYRACLGYVRAAMRRPAHYRLVFGDVQIHNPSKALEEAADQCVEYLYELVAGAQREGSLVQGDVRDIAALLWAALHGLVDLTLAGHLREPRMVDGAQATPRLVALALDSMTPPGQRPPGAGALPPSLSERHVDGVHIHAMVTASTFRAGRRI